MQIIDDTIAAVATAPGNAGIAVVRISGPDSVAIADRLLITDREKPSQTQAPALLHGHLCHAGEMIDEVLVLVMRRPRSYTREDVVEIQCHGGSFVSRRILRAILSEGARLAEPGEFTMRAFINGRIDLVQAEAVADLIGAESGRAASSALEQLKGSLSRSFESIYRQTIELAAEIEATLDFSEDDIETIEREKLMDRITRLSSAIDRLIATHEEGRLLRDGARVVIAGRPNVGKSTLLNRLVDSERAIVSHIPGTTRDTIEEHINIDGFPITLTDTAGLRTSKCEIEEEGIRRTIAQIDKADIHIYIVDSTIGISKKDISYLAVHAADKTILVCNKTDLAGSRVIEYPGISSIATSLINNQGVDRIKDAIRAKIEKNTSIAGGAHSTVSERHFRALTKAAQSVADTQRISAEGGDGWEVIAVASLRDAAESIGEILGLSYHNELLDSIFSKFCVGK